MMARKPRIESPKTARASIGLTIFAFAYLGLLYLPVLFLPVFSFNDSAFIKFPLEGFTTRWYDEALADQNMLAALVNSLKVGAISAVAATFLGLLAAKAVTRYRMRGASASMGVIMLPLFIPEIVLGISMLILFDAIALPLSLVTVTIGHIMLTVPFAMAVLIARMDGFDKSLEEASLDLGESAWMTFWRVTFPLVLPGIVSSLLLTFIVSFDEFLIAFFLAGTDPTLPVYIWSQLRFPAKLPGVLALGALILLASCFLVVLAEWLRRRGVSDEAKKGAIGI